MTDEKKLRKREYDRLRYQEHREEVLAERSLRRKAHPEIVRAEKRLHYERHREEIIAKTRQYAIEHPETNRRPEIAMRHHMRGRISDFLKGRHIKGGTAKLVGCSWGFLRNHIESLWQLGMSWNNYGYRGWHIDHIIPLSWFPSDSEWLEVAFHWTNLQPLWGVENMMKGAKAA